MSAATDRLAKATAKAKANIPVQEDTMAETTATTNTTTSKPKFQSVVTATTEFTIAKGFPFQDLGKVFKKVIIESQDCVGENGPFTRHVAKFVYRFAALEDIMGTPTLNINHFDNGMGISKNAEFDIDGKKGKYRKLNNWTGKASVSKQAVLYVQALIDQRAI